MTERLQKLLATSGIGSRRQVEEWMRAGRITVGGFVATLGQRADADADVRLDGSRLSLRSSVLREVLLYHKPAGEVTTRKDPQGRPTVFDRLPPPKNGRWIVVGRLDFNTTGLLLFTNDGELAHRLMHPSSEVQREYAVRVRGIPEANHIKQLQDGVLLDDGPARFDLVEPGALSASNRWFRVALREGRNREVRRLWSAVGFEVSKLVRVKYGGIALPDDLIPGSWRLLGPGQSKLL